MVFQFRLNSPSTSLERMRKLYAPLLVFVLSRVVAAAPCTICLEGEISKPGKALNILEPFSLPTCGYLNNVVSIIDDSTEDCAGIQTLGGLCGCPVRQNACRLCPSGLSLAAPLTELDPSSSSVLQSVPPGLAPTCEFVDSFLQVSSSDSDECLSTQETYQTECICEVAPDGGDSPTMPPSKEAVDDKEDPASDSSGCSVCPDGRPIGKPAAIVPIEIPNSPVPIETCEDLASAAAFVPSTSHDCTNGIQLLATVCGCDSSFERPNGCRLCPDGRIPEPDNQFFSLEEDSHLADYFISTYGGEGLVSEGGISCGLAGPGLATDVESHAEACFVNQLRRETCGCEPHPKLTAMNWCRRVSAILSLIGSSLIILTVMRDREKRTETYHQLVLGISCFDLISSLAYSLDHFLLPTGSSVPGVVGNTQTCKLQGMMIQLGYTSMVFNLLLSLYFWLTVSKGWKEYQMKRVRRSVYISVVFVWTGMALGGIPLYEPSLIVCSIPRPTFSGSWYAIVFFFFVPYAICLTGVTVATIMLFRSVYKLERSSSRWRLAIHSSDTMTVKVFWRCFWYLLAFYVPWPMYFASFFVELTERNYGFWLMLQIFMAMQGFCNALVYYYRSSRASFCSTSRRVFLRPNTIWMQPTVPTRTVDRKNNSSLDERKDGSSTAATCLNDNLRSSEIMSYHPTSDGAALGEVNAGGVATGNSS
eukprot:scaffold17809_cov115-Cylindrotheca_fusiformis.AAC.4